MNPLSPIVSVVIVSFNTRELLRDCLHSLDAESEGITKEVFVIDNTSRDGSCDMVAREFPDVHLIRSDKNLGFAGANNQAFRLAKGRYIVLLNSDAFLTSNALLRAIQHMDNEADVGIGGGRLIGRDSIDQPAARLFPSFLNHFLIISGLAARYPRSHFWGRMDRTWADPKEAADVDWVPGAFSIIRRRALEQVGYFDENFFLYFEEVDLCKRFKNKGHKIRYWPDVVVIHLGGESSKTVETLRFASTGSQLTLWQLRSAFLYYRKHHGSTAWLIKSMEQGWHRLRQWKNRISPATTVKANDSDTFQRLIEQAWQETLGGRVSPPRPW